MVGIDLIENVDDVLGQTLEFAIGQAILTAKLKNFQPMVKLF